MLSNSVLGDTCNLKEGREQGGSLVKDAGWPLLGASGERAGKNIYQQRTDRQDRSSRVKVELSLCSLSYLVYFYPKAVFLKGQLRFSTPTMSEGIFHCHDLGGGWGIQESY